MTKGKYTHLIEEYNKIIKIHEFNPEFVDYEKLSAESTMLEKQLEYNYKMLESSIVCIKTRCMRTCEYDYLIKKACNIDTVTALLSANKPVDEDIWKNTYIERKVIGRFNWWQSLLLLMVFIIVVGIAVYFGVI